VSTPRRWVLLLEPRLCQTIKPYGAVDKFDPGKKATSHDRSGETIDSDLGGEAISAALKYLRAAPREALRH
jgi:hypothetical protein